jgi:hypothetical protein
LYSVKWFGSNNSLPGACGCAAAAAPPCGCAALRLRRTIAQQILGRLMSLAYVGPFGKMRMVTLTGESTRTTCDALMH